MRASLFAKRRLIVAVLFLGLTACQMIKPPPSGLLRVVGDVDDAAVWVDDVYGGRAVDWRAGRQVRAGFHRVEVRKPDHYSHFAELMVPQGGIVVVKALVRPNLD